MNYQDGWQRQLGGRTQIERFRRAMDARGVQYAADYFTYGIEITNLAPGATAIARIPVERDSAFEWLETTGGVQTAATGAGSGFTQPCNVSVQIQDAISARNLMNAPIPLMNVWGSAAKPFVLPVPRRFMPRTSIGLQFNNFDTAVTYTKINFQLVGRKIFMAALPGQNQPPPIERFNSWVDQQSGRVLCEDLFFYDTPLASLANATTQVVSLPTEADSDFEWIMTTLSGGLDTTASYLTGDDLNLRLQIKDTTGNMFLFQEVPGGAFTPAAGAAGTGTFPFILQQPHILNSKTQVDVTFVNSDTAVTMKNLHLTMVGRKIFEPG